MIDQLRFRSSPGAISASNSFALVDMAGNETLDDILSQEGRTRPISDSFIQPAPPEKFRIWTFSGPVSISEESSRRNTYRKTVRDLRSRLLVEKGLILHRTLRRLNEIDAQHGVIFKRVLSSLGDQQFVHLVEAFKYALNSALVKYIEILASLPGTSCDGMVSSSSSGSETSRDFQSGREERSLEEDHVRYFQDRDDPSDVSTAPGHTITSEGTDVLCRRMHDLPQDIFSMIRKTFFRACFGPIAVFPQQAPDNYGHYHFRGEAFEPSRPAAFLALNKHLVKVWKRFYFEHNLWVIGPGPPDATTDFLNHMGGDYLRIRKVHLCFSIEDDKGASDLLDTIRKEMRIETGTSKLDNLKVLERFATHCQECSRRLQRTWRIKFCQIALLNLDELTLDFRKAYAPDDEFLANGAWVGSFTRFSYGLPNVLEILAPNNHMKADLEELFLERNA